MCSLELWRNCHHHALHNLEDGNAGHGPWRTPPQSRVLLGATDTVSLIRNGNNHLTTLSDEIQTIYCPLDVDDIHWVLVRIQRARSDVCASCALYHHWPSLDPLPRSSERVVEEGNRFVTNLLNDRTRIFQGCTSWLMASRFDWIHEWHRQKRKNEDPEKYRAYL